MITKYSLRSFHRATKPMSGMHMYVITTNEYFFIVSFVATILWNNFFW